MKVKKISILFFGILVLIFMGAMSSVLVPISLCTAVIFSILIGISGLNGNESEIPIGIIYLLTFQNFCIGIGAHIFENTSDSLRYLTQIPFISIFMIWGILQFKIKKNNKSRLTFYILLLCLVISMLNGRGNFISILINIRNLTIFYFVYEIGIFCFKSKKNFDIFVKKFLFLAKIVLVLGIIILIGGFELYELIGIREVYIAKGSPIDGDRLGGRFTTTLVKKQYTRMGSIYYEPVNLAYFYSAGVIITLFYKWTDKKFSICLNKILMICGLILTFGKGGYMIAGATVLFYYGEIFVKNILKGFSKKIIKRLTLILIITLITIFCIMYYLKIGAAVRVHFWAVMSTWISIKRRPLGYGIGTGGNAAAILGGLNGEWLESGGESALMSFMYQIGIQGIIAFIWCFSTTAPKIYSNDKFGKILMYIPYILIGVSILQDNTFTPQCITIFMLLQGAQNIFINENTRKD